jgi:hypothetical protein
VQRHRLTAILFVAPPCVLIIASCASSPSPPNANGRVDGPPLTVQDDGDPPSDPDVGAGIGSEPPSSGWNEPPAGPEASASGSSPAPEGWFTYHVCVLLKRSCDGPRVAFCNSQPDVQVRGRCFSHVKDSPVAWENWCYNEFRNE